MTILEAVSTVEGILTRARTRPSGQARIHTTGEEAVAMTLVCKFVRSKLS